MSQLLPRRAWALWALWAPLAAVGACGSTELAGGVSDSAFVTTMVALERIQRTPGLDSSARVAARSAALQGQGLTQPQLEAAANALADEPARALALYRLIERRASGDTAARADTTATTVPRRR